MNKTPAIVVLGGGLLQCPLVTAVNSLGFCSIVVDQNSQCHARYMAGIFLCISIREHKNILTSLQCINHCMQIIDVQTIGTDFTLQRNYLRGKLNVERMSVFHTLASNHKYHMRRFLEGLRISIPVWKKIRSNEELLSMVRNYGQVVLKPVDNMGARGVTLLEKTSDIKQQLSATLQNSSVRYALAESVISGEEYSVDVVIRNAAVKWCGIAQRIIILRPHFIEIGHYFSSETPRAVIRSLKKAIRKVVRAIPARHYQLKFDIFCAQGVSSVNEFASRLSGGFMSGWTYPLYSNIQPAELILNQHAPRLRTTMMRSLSLIRSIAHRIRLLQSRDIVIAEGSVISIPGIVSELPLLLKIRMLPAVVVLFAKISRGDTVHFPQNNIDKCFHIIIACHSAQHSDIFMKIRAYLLPRLAPHQQVTERFLWGQDNSQVRKYAYILDDSSHQPTIVALFDNLVATATLSPQTSDALHRFASYRDWHGIPLSIAIKIIFWKYFARFRPHPQHIRHIVDALFKGGLQGAVYYIDTIHSNQSIAVEYVDTTDH